MARISYVDPSTIEDEDIQAFFEESRRIGAPRPEIQAIRAHQPDVLRAFMYSWNRLFRGGIVDFQLKELCRMRVATTVDCRYCANQRAVQEGEQVAQEGKLGQLERYEESDLFSEREKVALRYTDAITWNPNDADDKLWADLHRHFSEPEIVELGAFVSIIAGGQRWIRTLDVKHGEVMFDSTGGLSEQITKELQEA